MILMRLINNWVAVDKLAALGSVAGSCHFRHNFDTRNSPVEGSYSDTLVEGSYFGTLAECHRLGWSL